MKNNLKLEEIRKRVNAATDEPWKIIDGRFIASRDGMFLGDLVSRVHKARDCDFIANVREDVPWLISEIDRLNSGIDSVLYDLRNEDITNPHVVEQITENLVAVLNGK